MKYPVVTTLTLPLLLSSVVSAASYDESIDGDLSTDPLNPTPIVFDQGVNVVVGTVQSSADTRDYFTFNVGDGQLLTGIFLNNYFDLTEGGAGNRGFIHIDDGTSSVVPGVNTINEFLGGSHLDRTLFPDNTTNILSRLAGAPEGGVGFTDPLGAGSYTINVQQTGTQPTGYEIAVNIAAVPEPNMIWMLGAFSVMGVSARRRRRDDKERFH